MRRSVLTVLVLLTPIFVLAGRLPGLESAPSIVRGLPAEAVIDYSRTSRGFAPLSAEYFARLYGERASPGVSLDDGRAPSGGAPPLGGSDAETAEGVSDSFDGAVRISRLPFYGSGDTRAASREPNEPASCARVGGTVWYRFTATTTEQLTATTTGSSYPTTLGVFSGSDLDALQEVGCATEPRGNTLVSFVTSPRRTYFFQISGPVGGDLRFRLDRLGTLQLASTSPSDRHATKHAGAPSISDNGRYLVFASEDALTPRAHERCACSQIYLRDLVRGTTHLVSVGIDGSGGDLSSLEAAISGNGDHVVFQSFASNLVEADTNGISDIFVRDLRRGITERISITADGQQATAAWTGELERNSTGDSFHNNRNPAISRDGSVVAFVTQSPNLSDAVCPFPCGTIVLRDRSRGTFEHICTLPDGTVARNLCALGSLSADGRLVVFNTPFPGVVEDDTGTIQDVFVRDRAAKRTTLVSRAANGAPGNADSVVRTSAYYAGARHISDDGRWVVFGSFASDLTPGDTEDSADVFVRDLLTGVTTRLTPGAAAPAGETQTFLDVVTISPDGRVVAYSTKEPCLPEDDDAVDDICVRNLVTGAIVLASAHSRFGGTVTGQTPSLSANGVLALTSFTALAPEDTDESAKDVFVRHLPASIL